jgi:hypothetical protein
MVSLEERFVSSFNSVLVSTIALGWIIKDRGYSMVSSRLLMHGTVLSSKV